MNLVSVNSTVSQGSINSLLNQNKNSNFFSKGNTFNATVVGKNKNNFILEAFGNVRFETSFSSSSPNIGDSLQFEVINSGSNGVALKLINHITPPSTKRGVNQISDSDIMELFKQSNFVKDEDSSEPVDDIESIKEDKAKISRAISKIKNQLSYTSDNLSLAAVNELLAKGISMDKITLDTLNSMLHEIEANPSIDIPESDLEAIINNSNTNKSNLGEKKCIVKALLQHKLPTSDHNIESLEKVIECFNKVKSLDDSAIIHTLKEGKSLTLDNIYLCRHSLGSSNIYKDNVDNSIWENLKPEINKTFINENIENTKENIEISKLLFSNELPITKDNVSLVSFLRGLEENLDLESLVYEGCQNIRKDIPSTNIDLTKTVYSKESQDLNNTYKNILRDLPHILPDLVLTVESLNKPVTLYNLRQAMHVNDSVPSSLSATSQNNITYRRELAEIQLKLTSEAAFRLADKKINIDTMPLSKVVEELRLLEKESYGKTLTTIGAEPSTQNVERMVSLYDSINNFNPLSANVFADIIKNKTLFSVEGINKSQLAYKAMEGYEAFLTTPNTKYGDSFNKLYDQFYSVVENLGISPTEGNVRAASILSKSKIDVNYESILQVKVIDEKINYIQDTLHPHIAASIIKDGLNPLNMHVDQLISYIDSFNDKYGNNLREKISQHILEMDLKNDLSKEDRDSMVAIYRMLNEIQKNNSASLGLNIKSGQDPTLGHLLEASKYYSRTHGDFNYTDIHVDNNFGGVENYNTPTNSIRSLLDKTYQAETADNISRVEALLNKVEDVTPLMLNELIYNEMLLRSTSDKLSSEVFSNLISSDTNLWNEPLPALLDKIENMASNKIFENLEKSKEVVDNIKHIIKSNPNTINFLESNSIPTSLINIQSMTALLKNHGYIGKKLNSIEEENDLSLFDDLILDSPIEYIGDNDSLKKSLNNISDSLDKLCFESNDTTLVKEVKLLQNAIKVQDFISRKQEVYSIPIRLHDKVSNLNIYIPNGSITKNHDINIAISIDSPKIGEVNSYIKAQGNNLTIYLNSNDNSTLELLINSKSTLIDILIDSGYNLQSIQYNENIENIENIENPYNSVPKNSINKDIKTQMFELAASITKYLDKI